jgi:hypothetical protein
MANVLATFMTVKAASLDWDILASVRLWSEHVDLAISTADLDPAGQIVRKGDQMAAPASKASWIAPRNYYATRDAKIRDPAGVNAWLDLTVRRLRRCAPLLTLIQRKDIEAVFWIYVAGGVRGQLPAIPGSIVSRVTELGARIYIEHWFAEPEPIDGWPERIWLPAGGAP